MTHPATARALAGLSILLAAPIAAPIAGPALAQDTTGETVEVIETDPVIVSAARGPVSAATASRAYTVITAEELEARQIRFVADALRQVPGLAVSRLGGPGGLTQVRVRGSEANHVLVLIDGIETANSAGGFDFSTLVISDIERIEVVRGPQSAVWGANAAAGVINIITKRGPRGDVQFGGEIEVGTDLSRAASAYLRGGGETFDVAFTAGYRDQEGYDISGDPGGRRDGLESINFGASFTADVTEALKVGGTFRITDRESDFDETSFGCGTPDCYVFDFPGVLEGQDIVAGLNGSYEMLGGALTHSFNADYARQDQTSIGAFGATPTITDTLEFGYQATYAFGPERRHALTAGTEFTLESFEGGIGVDESRTQTGVFGEYRGDVTDDLYLQAGLRYDINEGFSNAFTWSVSGSYRVAPTDTRFHASIGEGVVNPDFFEQYGFIPASFAGNPNLKPEENFAWDIGVEQSFLGGDVVLDVTYFNERLRNEIVTVFGAPSTAANVNGISKRQGIEVALSVFAFEGFSLTGSYTYLDAAQPSGAEVRRPMHIAGLNAQYRFLEGDAGIAVDVSYNGRMKDADFSDPSFTSPIVTVDSYVIVDVAFDYRVTEEVTLFGRIENVLDTDYQEVIGYDGQPLTGYMGVRFTF